MTLFLDTSVLYAAADRSDRGNRRAKAIISEAERLLTTDHVIVESWLLAQRRLSANAAERLWSAVRTDVIEIECVGPADLETAWTIGQDFADQGFSIVDRTSFAVMQRLGIQRVASFDSGFAIFRYGPRRQRAFDVVR